MPKDNKRPQPTCTQESESRVSKNNLTLVSKQKMNE